MTDSDWVRGDLLHHGVPAHPRALREGGEDFLTSAFHACGALPTDNRVTRITQFDESSIGGTGQKVFLAVEYEKPAPRLHEELFVKFSRDFTDPRRDRSRHMMESEVRLALLSRRPGFPVHVPACYFADYHHKSGTGVLITERIAFGKDGIEPCYEKCVDYAIPQVLEHYSTLLAANARLAGAHRGKRLGTDIEAQFPYEPQRLLVSDRIPYSSAELQRRTNIVAEFAAAYPQLLPANVRSPAFLARLAQQTQHYLAHELAIKQYLYGASDYVALCHWNANIDNGWFWRNPNGVLECGLLDWGRVTQLPLGQAIFGALCAAETDLWDRHLDELLLLFAREYRQAGGPAIDVAELKRHVQLFTALMGIAWVIAAPSVIKQQVPDLNDIKDRYDARLKSVALARVQLQLLRVFLNAWERQDFGAVLDELLPHLPAKPAISCSAAECR